MAASTTEEQGEPAHPVGLVVSGSKTVLPLKSVHIKAIIASDMCCEVILEQHYVNPTGDKETKYIFPLASTGAIYKFQAQLDSGAIVEGIVKDKEKAKKEYKQAVSSGKKAFLGEQNKRDLFEVSVGNLRKGEGCKITLAYNSELDVIADEINLVLPQIMFPRYGQNLGTAHSSGSVEYPVTIDLDVYTNTQLTKIDFNAKHLQNSGLNTDIENPNHGSLSINFQPNEVKGDLVFKISQASVQPFSAVIERSAKFQTECLRLSIREDSLEQILGEGVGNAPLEIYFLIDVSGSMSGGRMNKAKEAMKIFMRSLSPGCFFQLIEFNNNASKCFRQSNTVEYNEDTFRVGNQWVDNLHAGGGTNILGALQACGANAPGGETGRNKNVILLTDGEVSNEQECIFYGQSMGVRIFTLGVGNNFSEGLCRGLADAGQGSFEAARESADISAASMRLLAATNSPFIENPVIDLGAWNDGGEVVQSPKHVAIKPGHRSTFYFRKVSILALYIVHYRSRFFLSTVFKFKYEKISGFID